MVVTDTSIYNVKTHTQKQQALSPIPYGPMFLTSRQNREEETELQAIQKRTGDPKEACVSRTLLIIVPY